MYKRQEYYRPAIDAEKVLRPPLAIIVEKEKQVESDRRTRLQKERDERVAAAKTREEQNSLSNIRISRDSLSTYERFINLEWRQKMGIRGSGW